MILEQDDDITQIKGIGVNEHADILDHCEFVESFVDADCVGSSPKVKLLPSDDWLQTIPDWLKQHVPIVRHYFSSAEIVQNRLLDF